VRNLQPVLLPCLCPRRRVRIQYTGRANNKYGKSIRTDCNHFAVLASRQEYLFCFRYILGMSNLVSESQSTLSKEEGSEISTKRAKLEDSVCKDVIMTEGDAEHPFVYPAIGSGDSAALLEQYKVG